MIPLPNSFAKNSQEFAKLLLNYNKTHNITGAKDLKTVQENIDDSVYPLQFLPHYPRSAIDIGSGAGFPAILLALALQQCHFTLYEPIAKKSAFLHIIKSEFSLANVEIKTARVEADTPRIVDLITSRAVGDTNLLIKLSKGFYDKNTLMLLYKGARAEEEISGLKNARLYERDRRKYVLLKELA